MDTATGIYAKAPNALKAAAIPAVVAASGLSQPLDLFSASDDVEVLDGAAAATPVRNSSSEQLLPGSSRSEDSRTPASKNVSNGRVVRPFVRTPKAPREKPADAFASLLQEVISHQKIASSRVSPFESAVAAFKAGHAEGLTSAEVRGIICLFSENAPFVNQFLSFDEESRDFIIAEKLTQLDN